MIAGLGLLGCTGIIILVVWVRKLSEYNIGDVLENKTIRLLLSKLPTILWSTGGIAVLVFIGGVWLFKNPVPAILAGATIILYPWQVAYRRKRKRQLNAEKELSGLVYDFAGFLEKTGQISAALEIVGQAPGRVAKHINKAYSRIAIYKEDQDVVLQDLADKIDIPYGYIFVDLIKQTESHGTVTAQLFYDLSDSIENNQDINADSMMETKVEKVFNSIMALSFVPIYILMLNLVPEINTWLTTTFAGKMVVTLCFLSIVAWFFVERVVDEF